MIAKVPLGFRLLFLNPQDYYSPSKVVLLKTELEILQMETIIFVTTMDSENTWVCIYNTNYIIQNQMDCLQKRYITNNWNGRRVFYANSQKFLCLLLLRRYPPLVFLCTETHVHLLFSIAYSAVSISINPLNNKPLLALPKQHILAILHRSDTVLFIELYLIH